ncbi:AAA family ATPase [Jeotgalibacillus salarius]|uniref:Nuclease SbcCD subunit C n=1 Tax=Jeotgalibacillus salarius TaxID=546023 RepID=A0A4Y8LN89_9BACL|nr:AAA family ATPase [Jeotgalibacillus salarius]TFE02911.1 hypothetical protein E2626_03640 [Jeotgalibacillus salarius]
MRPIKLVMSAFGPYAKTEEIHFDELGSRTMFVISGKTGAGKTTIFDAIAFALYGKTSGEERSAQDLRSDFADEDLLTSVDFTFALKRKIYRINRSPIQVKKKSRGEGYTTVSAKAEFYELIDGEHHLIGATLSESDEHINRLMQLDFHQFKQILMIPQGEFRTLLTSDSTDKERILQKLFHTESYRFFQDYLKSKSKELRDQADGYSKDRERLFSGFDPLDHEELKEALTQGRKNEKEIIIIAKNLVATQKEKSNINKKDITNKRENYKKVLKAIESASYVERAFNELEKTNAELNQLEEQSDIISQAKQTLHMTIEAETIWPYYQDANIKKEDKRVRSQYGIETHGKLIAMKLECAELQKTLESLKDVKEEFKLKEKKQTELLAFKDKTERYHEKSKDLSHHAEIGKAERGKLDQFKKQLTENETLREKLLTKQQSWYENQNRSSEIKIQLNSIHSVIKMFQELDELESTFQFTIKELNNKKGSLSDFKIKLDKEQVRLDQALHEQSAQHALELSRELKDGEACPVCGSPDHPNPAKKGGDIVDSSVFQRNIQLYQSEVIKLESAIEHLNAKLKEVEQNKQKLNSEITASELYDGHDDIHYYLELKTKKNHEHEELIKFLNDKEPSIERKEVEQQSAELKQKTQELEEIVQQKRDAFISIRTQVNQLKEEIPSKYLDTQYLSAEIRELDIKITAYKEKFEHAETAFQQAEKEYSRLSERYKQALEEESKAEVSYENAAKKLEEVIEGSIFSEVSDLVQSKLEKNKKEELDNQISSYEKKVYALNEYAEKLKMDLENVSRPDIKVLNHEKETVEKEIEQLEERTSSLIRYITHHENLLVELEKNMDASSEVEKSYKITGHLSEIANGQNELKLTFERFVLAYYLEDILLVANERLLKMTSGRYELHRKEDRSKGNKQGGLELLVMDHYTGQQRHVKTLSGGEAFKASLALALGLADVVQSYAGGVSLETMFIDEGFGTLDPESLDQAIESLMDIQAGGRLVGVISHVPELKERIDARLEVFSSKGGSSTKFIFESI